MLFALIRKELLALSRDLHGLAALFVLPIVFIVVMSMALKDVYSPHVDKLNWSVMDQDHASHSEILLSLWETEHGKPIALPADWRKALIDGRLKYVIQIEAGATEDLQKISKPNHPRIIILTEPGIDFGVFTSLQAQVQSLATALRVETIIKKVPEFEDMNPDDLSGANVAVARRIDTGPRPTSVQHNVPAWLVFGMFFVITTITGLFIEERSCGALNRLRSLGVSPWTQIMAKVLPFMLINCVQAALMLGVGIYLIPLLGGDALSLRGINWPALITMLLAISLAAICLALFVASIVKSQAQASTIGPMLNILMAAIGGIMVPTFVMPAVMQKLSRCSPMNWALEGLLNVLLRGGNLASIRYEAGLLLILAMATLSLTYLIFRFKKS